MGMIADYASFRKMISTTVIQIIFWVVVAGLIILGLISFGSGIYDSLKGSYTPKWNGIPYWVLIPVFAGIGIFIWRVFCEAAIVVFRIADTLTEINEKKNQ